MLLNEVLDTCQVLSIVLRLQRDLMVREEEEGREDKKGREEGRRRRQRGSRGGRIMTEGRGVKGEGEEKRRKGWEGGKEREAGDEGKEQKERKREERAVKRQDINKEIPSAIAHLLEQASTWQIPNSNALNCTLQHRRVLTPSKY